MDVKWEYETEGYDLGGGVRYLPDFWVADSAFVEIKPLEDKEARTDHEKWRRLATQSQRDVFVVFGAPGEMAVGGGICFGLWDGAERDFEFAECRKCCGLAYNATDGGYGMLACKPGCESEKIAVAPYARTLADAVGASRSARFEHGETDWIQAPVAEPPKVQRAMSSEETALRLDGVELARRMAAATTEEEKAAILKQKIELSQKLAPFNARTWKPFRG